MVVSKSRGSSFLRLGALALKPELFGEDAFVEGVVGVAHHVEFDVAGLFDFDADDGAGLEMVGDGGHEALGRFQHFDGDARLIWQQRAAPAPGAEGANGRQGQQGCVDGHNGAVGRQVIGGRASGGCHKDPVADQFLQADRAVDGDAELGGLGGFAKQRDLVDCERLMGFARTVGGDHRQRVDAADFGVRQALVQVIFAVLVHKEADRPAIHAEDRDVVVHVAMEGLEHQAVAAEGDNGIGLARGAIAVDRDEFREGCLRVGAVAGDESDAVVGRLGFGHFAQPGKRR